MSVFLWEIQCFTEISEIEKVVIFIVVKESNNLMGENISMIHRSQDKISI